MTGVADQSLSDETIAGEATTDPLVPVFIEQRERLATVTAERDEWKQRAEKAEEVIEKARSKYKNVWMQLYDDDIERLTDERDQTQERVEELERLISDMSEFFASRSGNPTTTETPRVERLAELLDQAREILRHLADAHHRTLTGSKKHDPARLDFTECPCLTCAKTAAFLASTEPNK